MIRFYYKFQAT